MSISNSLRVAAAFSFIAVAAACANTEQHVEETPAAAVVVAIPSPWAPGAAEFHGADIGGDSLRNRLGSES